ncbi:MAG TPA: SagB/ThcOx family dehydrogenase [Nitrospirota bacterium]|nr:SagB/ThcOx family dehydrogenase [Nitrospirota bacterium]
MKLSHPFLFSSLLTVFFSSGAIPVANSASDRAQDSVKLPEPLYDSKTSVEKALQKRRSLRQYRNLPITLQELSQLLWAAQGISGTGGRRTAPSAGALYPLEICVVAGNVTGLSAGIYSYDPHKHELSRSLDSDKRAELSKASLGQSSINKAAAILVISAVYERVTGKYGERGIRYVHMEAGHAAQNVFLQAVSLDLGTVVIGAFQDEEVRAVLHHSGQVQPLYLMPMGKK